MSLAVWLTADVATAAPLQVSVAPDRSSVPAPPDRTGPSQKAFAPEAGSNVLFLNFDGATLVKGSQDDATQNVTTSLDHVGDYAPYGDGPKRAAVLEAVKAAWAPYNVVVTDVRPEAGPYTMAVVTPTTPFPGSISSAAVDCYDQSPAQIGLAFLSEDDNIPANDQARYISRAFAIMFGLDLVEEAGDIMSSILGNNGQFTDQCRLMVKSSCSSQHEQFCPPGQQNSHQEMMWLFGPPDLTAPAVTITAPMDGAFFDIGAAFTVTADVVEDGFLVDVMLYANGSPLQSDPKPPYEWAADNIPAGVYVFEVEARDSVGNVTRSTPVTVNVGEEPPSPGTTGPDSETTDVGSGTTMVETPTTGDAIATTGDTTSTTGDANSTTDGADQDGDEGCGCATRGGDQRGGLLLLGAALTGLLRRRRP